MLARGSRFRLDAEVIRDQILVVSGLLNTAMYGKSVKPPQPPGLWKLVAMPTSNPYTFQADTGDKIYRRSIYSFWKRGLPPPQMTIFDAPTRESCTARRERTNTPLQALVLMNEEQFFSAARHYARGLTELRDRTDEGRIRHSYETITSQLPDAATMATLQEALSEFRSLYEQNAAAARAVLAQRDDKNTATSTEQPAELAAWTMLVHSLLNLDVTKTRQ